MWHCCQRHSGIVAIALLLSWRWRCLCHIIRALSPSHCCHHGAGVVVALASLPSLLRHCCHLGASTSHQRCRDGHHCHLSAGIVADVAVVAMATLLLSRQCRHRGRRPGAGAIIKATLLPSPLRCCHHCSCGAGVLADIAMTPSPPSLGNCHHRGAGVLVALAPLPSLLGHCAGVLAVVAMGSLSSWRWHHCPCRDGAVVAMAPLSRWRHCRGCGADALVVVAMSIIVVAAQGPLPLLQWHRCCHRSAGVIAGVNLALCPRQRCDTGLIARVAWCRCHRHCRGAYVLVDTAMAPLPTSLGQYRRWGTGGVIPVAPAPCLGGIALATPLLEVGHRGPRSHFKLPLFLA
jgi:hypothetical protein